MAKQRVAVMLSGGVDSAVAAAFLKKRGFGVVSVFMKNWSVDVGQGCPWVDDQRSARAVTAHLGLSFYTFNFEREYKKQVVDYFLAEYAAGRTPNPDIKCNEVIKFKAFVNEAKKLGIKYIATGHYSRLRHTAKGVELLKGVDSSKDQSYFLYRVSPAALKNCFFPVGRYTKRQVRALAQKFGLPNADRPDSQGICFMGEISVADFLRDQLKPVPGPIMTVEGEYLGKHEGLALYTIGQRHGLKVGGGIPYYVAQKQVAANTLVVAKGQRHAALYKREIALKDWLWTTPNQPKTPSRVQARIRYQQPLQSAKIMSVSKNGRALVVFKEPQFGVASGQSLVAYQGARVLGGGIIT